MSRISIPPAPNKVKILLDEVSMKVSVPWLQWFEGVREEANPSTQDITAAEAVDPNTEYTSLSVASGTYAVTLAVPEVEGRTKIIEMIDASGTSVTLALTNVIGGSAGTTATFNAVNETLVLVSVSDKWVVINETGVTLS